VETDARPVGEPDRAVCRLAEIQIQDQAEGALWRVRRSAAVPRIGLEATEEVPQGGGVGL
jgi:hypothetical protein